MSKNSFKKHIPMLIGKYLQVLHFFAPNRALLKAFNLFCTPRKGKIEPDHQDFLDDAYDEIIIVDTLEIQTYRWAGNKETILLVHGWESNTHRWKELIEQLQEFDYNIIALDAPAHGNSSGKILNIPLYAECVQKIVDLYRPNHIIGHSVGGMTTLFHQYKYPDPEINKLVILAPPSELSRIISEFKNVLKLSDKFMQSLNEYFKKRFGFYFDEFSVATFSKSVTKKGLLIHDTLDDIAPYSESVMIAENWKNARFITTEGLGHSLFDQNVYNKILLFLKE